MRRSPILLAALLAACGPPLDDDDSASAGGTLDVLTYNVHGLPDAIAGDDPAGRMPQIAPLLNDFDLVGIQEAFVDEYYAALTADATHTDRHRFDDVLTGRVYGSGLGVLARYPTVAVRERHYETCHGTTDNASDCLASKGYQVVRLALGEGAEVDVYNTHLEAGGGALDHETRQDHVARLVESMAGFSAGRAVVLVGDMNLHADDAEDVPLLTRFAEDAGLRDSCVEVSCAEANHIDRIFVRDGAGLTLTVESWTREADFVDADGADLSDHPAISAVLAWAGE